MARFRKVMEAEVIVPREADGELLERDDGGMSYTIHVDPNPEGDFGLFAAIKSWDTSGEHETMRALLGKRVRVIVQVSDV